MTVIKKIFMISKLVKERLIIMQRIKKYAYYILLILNFAGSSFAADNLDNLNEFDFDNPQVNAALENPQLVQRVTPQECAFGIITTLQVLGILDLIEENLFLRTNPLNKRNLVDYPLFLQQKANYDFDWLFGGHLFYNQTSRMYFTSTSDSISSYLAITSPTFLEKLTNVELMIPNLPFEPIDVLPLFRNGTTQERKLGVMFYLAREFKSADMRFWLPLYYLERNYFFTPEERQAIEDQLGAASPEQQEKFQDEHLIADKFGLGDTRFELDFKLKECEDYSVKLGFLATIPTAVAFAKGIKGSYFDKCCPRPELNFQDILGCGDIDTVAAKERAVAIIQHFLTASLDHLSANLLETGLGDEGHFGLGLLLYANNNFGLIFKRPWACNLNWDNRISLEYLFANDEKRFFGACPNTEEFNSRDFDDPDQAISNLAFLEAELVNRFFPYVFNATVFPGLVFWWTTKWHYEGRKWGGYLGNDIWAQGKEKLRDLDFPEKLSPLLNPDKALLPFAFQSKIIGSLYYKADRETRDWTIGLNGDYTYASRGIGKDFMITFNLEANF